jgi:hypothetical protein
MPERKAILHVGTHKTGTKTLQSFFADNWDTLYSAGLYVPNAGRIELGPGEYSPGQHRLARADDALLQELEDELKNNAAAKNVLLSSEEFYPQLGSPTHLARLKATLERLGYACSVVLYLRPQAGFAESIYAETTKGFRPPSFDAYVQEIIERGARYPDSAYTIIFEYSRALLAFADIFGPRNIIVRAFVKHLQPSALVEDFIRTLVAALGVLDTPKLQIYAPALNARQTFGSVLRRIDAGAIERYGLGNDERLDDPFSPMLESEEAAMNARFNADNAEVERMAGIRFSKLSLHEGPRGWEGAAWQRQRLDAIMSDLA